MPTGFSTSVDLELSLDLQTAIIVSCWEIYIASRFYPSVRLPALTWRLKPRLDETTEGVHYLGPPRWCLTPYTDRACKCQVGVVERAAMEGRGRRGIVLEGPISHSAKAGVDKRRPGWER
jgi:hypothetical protein